MGFLQRAASIVVFLIAVAGAAPAATPQAMADMTPMIVQRVATMSNLQALTAAQWNAAGMICIPGYYGAGSAGGGCFAWNAFSPAVPDGGVIIAPADHRGTCASGCAFRTMTDGYVHSDYFGAIRDSNTAEVKATNLAALRATVQSAYRNGYNAYYDCGRYHINGTISLDPPLFGSVNRSDINTLKIFGCGRLQVFAIHLARGTVIVDDVGPVFKNTTAGSRYAGESANVSIESMSLLANASSTPAAPLTNHAIDLAVANMGWRLADLSIYQNGRGNGIECFHCFNFLFDRVSLLTSNKNTAAPSTKYGIGVHVGMGGRMGGFGTMRDVSSRGFMWGFKIGSGDTVKGDGPMNYTCQNCEVADDTNGWWIAPGALKTVLSSPYNDSGVDGTVVLDQGSGTIVREGFFWGGYAVGIDGTAAGNGNSYHDNELRVTKAGSVGIAVSTKGYGKTVRDNFIKQDSSDANVLGIKIEGTGPTIAGLESNKFSWVGGAGSKPLAGANIGH
jgi:hypothetical protein